MNVINYRKFLVPPQTLFSFKMAASEQVKGYGYKFVDTVQDYLYCKACSLVARKLNITSCCGESYCHACIVGLQKQDKPCPTCREKEFLTLGHIKNQRIIASLQVYCTFKERGCCWTGILEQLETHLDSDSAKEEATDSCQYVDTKCPLNCRLAIPKNKVEHHVAEECAKRPYVCQHCSFKGTYEEVADTHLKKCKYVPLQCPNLCGVTCEREHMEGHLKVCRLEEVACEFLEVGCKGRFSREDQEEHTRQSSQKHLSLTSSLAVELQKKLVEMEETHTEEKEALLKRIEEQENLNQELESQVGGLKEQDQELKQEMEDLREQFDSSLQTLGQKFLELIKTKSIQNTVKFLELSSMVGLNRRFEMRNFSREKARDGEWKSPAMYTHMFGYKFCLGVLANGRGNGRGKSLSADIWAMPGEFDSQLKWPAGVKFTVELINQCGGKNAKYSSAEVSWSRPSRNYEHVVTVGSVVIRSDFGNTYSTLVSCALLEHSQLEYYLVNDTLHFNVSKISGCYRHS